VEARHRHWVVGKEMFNTLPEGKPDSVAEFDTIEAETEDFVQHFITPRVTR
jgi:hypothetical protein